MQWELAFSLLLSAALLSDGEHASALHNRCHAASSNSNWTSDEYLGCTKSDEELRQPSNNANTLDNIQASWLLRKYTVINI